jgi:hypothetical protein
MSASSWFVVATHVSSRHILPRENREESMPSMEPARQSSLAIMSPRRAAHS